MAEKNFGDKLVGSIGWLLVGIILFLGSFWLLQKSIVRTDYSLVADKAIVASGSESDSEFVYATGEFNSQEVLGDDLYLNEDDYLVAERTVQMFAWTESVETNDDDVKFYSYETKWVEDVPNSSEFEEQRYHENPEKALRNLRETVNTASVDTYLVDLERLKLPLLEPLRLNEDNVTLYNYEEIKADEDYDYIFDGYGTFEEPEIGDLRIRYSVLKPDSKVTIFGRLDNNELVAHHGDAEKDLYRVFDGTVEDAKSQLKGEYKTAETMGEIGVMILMWISLLLILKPLTVSLELIPFIGKFGKGALVLITAILAFLITKIAAFVLTVINSIVGLVVIAAVVIGVGFYFYNKNKLAAKPKAK